MANASLRPLLDVDIPDLAVSDWLEVVRRAWVRSREIADQRRNYPEITDLHHDDWQLLHRFEYQHFYSGWVVVAFRLRACAVRAQDFTEVFERTHGMAQNEDLYQEDDALFDFFVKGFAAFESFAYALYALGALICTPNQAPSVPPSAQFPLLDPYQPGRLRGITPPETLRAFEQSFPRDPLTELLGRMFLDESYRQWSQIRNLLAHRVATAGRTIQRSPGFFEEAEPPLSVTQWASDLDLNVRMAASRYEWLKETINSGIEATATFVRQQLAYTDDQLPRLA